MLSNMMCASSLKLQSLPHGSMIVGGAPAVAAPTSLVIWKNCVLLRARRTKSAESRPVRHVAGTEPRLRGKPHTAGARAAARRRRGKRGARTDVAVVDGRRGADARRRAELAPVVVPQLLLAVASRLHDRRQATLPLVPAPAAATMFCLSVSAPSSYWCAATCTHP